MSQAKKSQSSSPKASPPQQRGMPSEVRMLLLIGIPILLAGIVFALLTSRNQTPAGALDDTRLIRPDSPVSGAADAPVTIVEFLDPECESCRAAHPAIKELLQTYTGRVRLVVRYFPLHTNSVLAALATEAAGEQDKYWEMQDLLFTRQPEWGENSVETPEVFTAYAQMLGLDIARFQDAMANPIYRDKIERDRQDGQALDVSGTPTFFVNGQLVEPLSYDRLVEMIEAALG